MRKYIVKKELPNLEITAKLLDEMAKRGLHKKDLMDLLGLSTTWVDKIMGGIEAVSPRTAKLMAVKFGWDEKETEKMAAADKLRTMQWSGKISTIVDPETEAFVVNFKYLDKEQKEILLSQLNTFISTNRLRERYKHEEQGRV